MRCKSICDSHNQMTESSFEFTDHRLNATFAIITGTQAILQKLVFIIGNLATVALAVYKCSSMGLLPTYASDWLDFVEPAMVRWKRNNCLEKSFITGNPTIFRVVNILCDDWYVLS